MNWFTHCSRPMIPLISRPYARAIVAQKSNFTPTSQTGSPNRLKGVKNSRTLRCEPPPDQVGLRPGDHGDAMADDRSDHSGLVFQVIAKDIPEEPG